MVFPQYTLYVDWNVVFNIKLSEWRLITISGQLCLIHAELAEPCEDGDSGATTRLHSVELSPQSSCDSSTQHSVLSAAALRQQHQRSRTVAAAKSTLSLASALASVVGNAKPAHISAAQ
jgi:hypothetical protein